ncbi:MAG: hypothetical protein KGJ13_09915 [Patescibacteria group bacterium]|nr:hypothetical protein [Patescibacteria group bacterium]
MNLLDAFAVIRNCAIYSPQLQTRQGKTALAVVDRKIQSLLRKKAWREGGGAIPIHMADPNFKYPLPNAENFNRVEIEACLGAEAFKQLIQRRGTVPEPRSTRPRT